MRFAVLIVAAMLLLGGCGGGPQVTETRDVGAYTALAVSADIDVDVVPGAAGPILVTGGRDVIDRVRTATRDGTLDISIEDRGIVIGPDPFDDVRIRVPAGDLADIHVRAGSDVDLGRVDLDALTLEIDGAGDIDAAGTVGELVLSIAGAGDANLDGLQARTAQVRIEGAGDADLNVDDELDVRIEGAGDVSYRGDPQVRQQVEGSGEVRPAD